MANAVGSCPWEGAAGDKRTFEEEYIHNALTDNMTTILKSLDLSGDFWTLLLQHSVVDLDTMRRIQAEKTRNMQALSLIHHIMEVQVYKFHGFIWALVNSNQCHLAELLGFDIRNYLDVEVYLKSSHLLCPACHEFYTKAYILTGCGHYVCAPCVKGAQFMCKQNQKEDVTCPVPECGIKTEAPPSAGNIGLEEDVDFNNLCQAMLKETGETTDRKLTTGREEGKSTAGTEEEEGMSNTEGEEKDKLSQHLQGGMSDLETNISCLKYYKDILGKHEERVKDYVLNSVEKVKQNIDGWAKETLGWYSSLGQQVEKNLQKSAKWQKVVSEFSTLLRARPECLEVFLKCKVKLPEVTVLDALYELIANLDGGYPIPPLLTRFPYMSVPPAKAKFLMDSALQHNSRCLKLAWLPDSSLMMLTDTGVWRMELNTDTLECKPTLIQEVNGIDMSVAADGTWILNLYKDGVIEVHYPGVEEVKRWRPEGVNQPWRVFINNTNIFVCEHNSPTIRSYSRDLLYVDQYDIGTSDCEYCIHVTESGTIIKSLFSESRIYTMEPETEEITSFSIESKGEVVLCGLCLVNDDEYILVCDWGNNRVSVFTHDGQFIHDVDVEGGVESPDTIAVLARRGKSSLMALNKVIDGRYAVGIYSLE